MTTFRTVVAILRPGSGQASVVPRVREPLKRLPRRLLRTGRLFLTLLSVLLAGLLTHVVFGQAPSPDLPPNVEVEIVADDVTFPVALRFAPDGRLFFNERFVGADAPVTGTIRVMVDGHVQAAPFAVIDLPDSAPFQEKGLLGLALDPDFESNSFVYAYRTAAATDTIPRQHGQILRYTTVLSGTDWIGADRTVVVDDLPVSSGCCHNGGILDFGPDGKLYLSIGYVDIRQSAQDLSNRAGNMLRFNPDGSIPDDNPFVGQPGVDPAVYAYGLRNVFGFDWHPITNELFATENGPVCNDELNLIVAGGNYGWPLSEVDSRCVDPGPEYVAPVLIFDPPPGLTDAAFYTGDRLPGYTNELFVGSWNTGALDRIEMPEDGGDLEAVPVLTNCGQPEGDHNLLSIEPAPDGSLYFSCQEEFFPAPPATGAIYRLVLRPSPVYLPLLRVSTMQQSE
ncbi:MAG: PQQ-dependent sugar dehydrogenase [Anaerolineae bacterium]